MNVTLKEAKFFLSSLLGQKKKDLIADVNPLKSQKLRGFSHPSPPINK
jgi:hypothetical protein